MLPPLLPVVHMPDGGPCIPFVDGHLYLGLAVEQDGVRRSVTDDELLTWDRPFTRLCDHAILRLRGRLSTAELRAVDTLPGLLCLHTHDGLATSRMLCLADLLPSWPLEGVLVAATDEDELLVLPLEGLTALTGLPSILRALTVAPRPVSDQLFWCDTDGEWHHVPVVYRTDGVDIDPDLPLMRALERAAIVDLVGVAAEA